MLVELYFSTTILRPWINRIDFPQDHGSTRIMRLDITQVKYLLMLEQITYPSMGLTRPRA